MLDWHARNFVWHQLLPRHISRSEMLALYARFLPFEQGSGLDHGASFYYSKSPSELTEREIVELLAISLSPSGNSPNENSDRFERTVQRIQDRLESRAA